MSAARCHNTEFISVTYDPQITRGNKSAIENKRFGKNTVQWVKQTFQLEIRESQDLAKDSGERQEVEVKQYGRKFINLKKI